MTITYSYCTIDDIQNITNIKSKHWFKNSQTAEQDFQDMINKWITLASGTINSYCNKTFNNTTDENPTPEPIRLACAILVSNILVYSQQRRDTPTLNRENWSWTINSNNLLSSDILELLEPYTIERDKDKQKIDIFCVSGKKSI